MTTIGGCGGMVKDELYAGLELLNPSFAITWINPWVVGGRGGLSFVSRVPRRPPVEAELDGISQHASRIGVAPVPVDDEIARAREWAAAIRRRGDAGNGGRVWRTAHRANNG